MARFRLAVGRTARGMTLMEVLAAVFCLGMGLIMVAGAFPAGAYQTQLTVDQTESSLLAVSAAEMVTAQRWARTLTSNQVQGDSSGALSVPINLDEDWMVWNQQRWAYLEDFKDEELLPPRGGDYVVRPFLTRLSGNDEVPFYRMTLVVGYFSEQAPDFYDRELMKDGGTKVNPSTMGTFGKGVPPGVRYISVKSVSGNLLTCTGMNPRNYTLKCVSDDRYIKPGDYIMNPRSGHCYRIATVVTETGKITLGETPEETLSKGYYYIFRNVVGVFYQLISD